MLMWCVSPWSTWTGVLQLKLSYSPTHFPVFFPLKPTSSMVNAELRPQLPMVVAEVPATEPDRCRSPHVLPGLRARRATATSHARLPRARMGIGNKIRNRNWKLWFYITLVDIYIYMLEKVLFTTNGYNVAKTMSCLPSPSHQHFYRCYGYHSLKWVVHDIVLPTLLEQVLQCL